MYVENIARTLTRRTVANYILRILKRSKLVNMMANILTLPIHVKRKPGVLFKEIGNKCYIYIKKKRS